MRFRCLQLCMALLMASTLTAQAASAQDKDPAQADTIRVGIIGLDTSHAPAFTKAFNDPDAVAEALRADLAGIKVVAAFPGGSKDVPDSANRVEGFTNQLRDMNVEIVDSIDALLGKVDAVLLESVDGRPHLDQVRPVFKAGKRVFLDKPVAGTLADAIEIYRLSQESGVPCFSSSALRFSPGIVSMRNNDQVGDILGCEAFSPCHLEPHHPDLYWYGIHGVELLYTIMGTGCKSVSRAHTENTDLVTGTWADGRVATYRGLRAGAQDYGALVFGSKGIVRSGSFGGYEPLVVEIARFFKTGKPPVSAEETIEIMAFMEAADESKRQGGAPVDLQTVIDQATKR